MHEWHTESNTNPLKIINEFVGFTFDTDYGGRRTAHNVKITNRVFLTHDEAVSFVTDSSYGNETPYLAAYAMKKLSKGYWTSFSNFLTRYNEYLEFSKKLTIAYGRTSSKATCPQCGSSINLKYGSKFKCCPVCGSEKIISDSNWKALNTKKRMAEKAAENLSKEAEKGGVTFVCGLEWHC